MLPATRSTSWCQGFPGKSVCHGALGWSSIVLLRGHGHIALVDVGSFGIRDGLIDHHLTRRGLQPSDLTDVLLTHAHHDHSVNWPLFPATRGRPWSGGEDAGVAIAELLEKAAKIAAADMRWTIERG